MGHGGGGRVRARSDALGVRLGHDARLPLDGDLDAPRLIDGTQRHIFDQESDDLRALGVRRGSRVPQARQILGERKDLGPLNIAQLKRRLLSRRLVLLLQRLELLEALVPLAFEGADDEPILRLDLVVAACRRSAS